MGLGVTYSLPSTELLFYYVTMKNSTCSIYVFSLKGPQCFNQVLEPPKS
jgi:hypothetical protein